MTREIGSEFHRVAHDQLVLNSLICWWLGSRLMFLEYQSSTFWFQLSEVHMLVVITQISSLGGGFSIDKATQNIICNPQGGSKCP